MLLRGGYREEVLVVTSESFMVPIEWTLVGPPALVRAWRREFHDTPVTIVPGDIIEVARRGALVSPANSFGWMDGGLDALIARAYAAHGVDITARVQAAIRDESGGELPVGSALVVPTPEGPYTHCIAAPTMRTPRPVPWSFHAYLAFRACGVALDRWNAAHPDDLIQHVFCPGLGTGVGHIPARRAARQMRAAWNQSQCPDIPPLWEALKQEAFLRGTRSRRSGALRGASGKDEG